MINQLAYNAATLQRFKDAGTGLKYSKMIIARNVTKKHFLGHKLTITLGYYLRLGAPESFFVSCKEGNDDAETWIESQRQCYDKMMVQVSLVVSINC